MANLNQKGSFFFFFFGFQLRRNLSLGKVFGYGSICCWFQFNVCSHIYLQLVEKNIFSLFKDNDSGRMDGVNQEKEPRCPEVVDSDFLDPKDPISQKDIVEAQEIIEGVGDKDTDFTSNKMVLDDIEQMMAIEDTSTQVIGFDKEQKLINEFELVMKGTEDLICDSDLIPLNTGFDEKHNDGCEVGLMDSQVDVEEGEISGDLGKDDNSYDVFSADALQKMPVDDVQKPVNVTTNMIKNQEKEKGCESTSSTVNSLQDANNSRQVVPRTGGNKGIAGRVEVAISEETFECKKEDKTKVFF